MAGKGKERRRKAGKVRRDNATQARLGGAWTGVETTGDAGEVRHGAERSGLARQARLGSAEGKATQASRVVVRR